VQFGWKHRAVEISFGIRGVRPAGGQQEPAGSDPSEHGQCFLYETGDRRFSAQTDTRLGRGPPAAGTLCGLLTRVDLIDLLRVHMD
jgi:hypothetical protein